MFVPPFYDEERSMNEETLFFKGDQSGKQNNNPSFSHVTAKFTYKLLSDRRNFTLVDKLYTFYAFSSSFRLEIMPNSSMAIFRATFLDREFF